MHPERQAVFGMHTQKMRKYKSLICLALTAFILLGLSLSSYAEGAPDEVEEVFDAVAQQEAEIAAAAAQAAAEAEKVNDIIDLYAEPEDNSSGESSRPDSSLDSDSESFSTAGPIRAFIVAGILIIGGVLVIAASNRKIKAGKRKR